MGDVLQCENRDPDLIEIIEKVLQVSDPVVDKMIILNKLLEVISREGSMVEGWRPLRLDNKGWVVAGKDFNGEYRIEEFSPIGKWKKAHEYLQLQNELNKLIFSDLTLDQINSYRAATGLPPIKND